MQVHNLSHHIDDVTPLYALALAVSALLFSMLIHLITLCINYI